MRNSVDIAVATPGSFMSGLSRTIDASVHMAVTLKEGPSSSPIISGRRHSAVAAASYGKLD